MAAGVQRFDFAEAERLKNTLKQEAQRLEADLRQLMGKVEGVRSWWSGGSEEAFIDHFRRTKDQIVASLNQVIEDYSVLIQKIADAKQQSDASLAQQLRGQ